VWGWGWAVTFWEEGMERRSEAWDVTMRFYHSCCFRNILWSAIKSQLLPFMLFMCLRRELVDAEKYYM